MSNELNKDGLGLDNSEKDTSEKLQASTEQTLPNVETAPPTTSEKASDQIKSSVVDIPESFGEKQMVKESAEDVLSAYDKKKTDAKKTKKQNTFFAKIINFFKTNEIANLSLVLCLITGVTALVLATVNGITAPIIAANAGGATVEAMAVMMPDAKFEKQELVDTADAIVTGYYTATSADAITGYFVTVEPQGYGGAISTVIGFDADGFVIGSEVITMSETSGIGDKVKNDPSFAAQFVDKDTVDGVDIISGATVSSNAYINGVSAAIDFVASIK